MSQRGLTGRTLLLAGCLLLAACGDRAPRLPPLSPGDTVLAFGDSLTHGTGAGRDMSYPAQLAGMTGLRVVNAGVPGERTAGGLARLPGLLARERPALVILCLGGNDLLRKVNPAVIKTNLRQMVSMARNAGAQVVLLGVPAPTPGLFGLSAAPIYRELAEELALPLEEKAIPEILADRTLKSDPIHPNAKGYRQLAEAIRVLLVERGAID